MILATKEWVISLLQKINAQGHFFDPIRLKYKFESEQLYKSAAKEKLTMSEVKVLGSMPNDICKADAVVYLYRESGSISGSAYPRISVMVNGVEKYGMTTDMYQGSGYTYNLNNLSANDEISIKFSSSASSYSSNASFSFTLTGNYTKFDYIM